MIAARRQMITGAVKVFDLLLMALSLGVAMLPVLLKDGPVTLTQLFEMRIQVRDFLFFSVLVLTWNFIFTMLGLYDSKRLSSRLGELTDTIKATSLGTLAIAIVGFLLKVQIVNPAFIAVFWVFSAIVAGGGRVTLRTWLRHIRTQGKNAHNMLIVGTNRRALDFALKIQSQLELGYRIIGFSDDQWEGSEELSTYGFGVVCDLETLPIFLRRNIVDEVVLALPVRSFHLHASTIAALCEQQGIILRVLPDLFNLANARLGVEELAAAPLVTHHTTITAGGALLAKRMFDFTLALVILIFASPLLVLVAVLIKLTSPGPVFFVQKRIGLNKRIFDIYKFRTMVVNAESKMHEIEHLNEVSGPVFKIKNDPRITPVGRFLRTTSIDELPQLFNVLKGDMSLVGPRPWQLRDYELFTSACKDWQRRRFSVRPGVTCLWQINGRNTLAFEKWMELDRQYIEKWSFWLDLKILAKTIPAVLRGSGAA